jgi:hypothetical protein
LAITQAIGLTGMFQWGMRQSTELENQMTSVERYSKHYLTKKYCICNPTFDYKLKMIDYYVRDVGRGPALADKRICRSSGVS